MKKKIMILLFACTVFSIQAQEIYLYSGKNFTTYNFINSSGNNNLNLMDGAGYFYEVGYNKKMKQDRFSYSLAFTLNEYNNIGGNTVNNYQWNTNFVGIQARLYYSYLKGKNYDLLSTIGLNLSTLLSGKQQINSLYYDLTKQKEFTGLLLSPCIGLQFKYNVTNLGYVSLGYNYVKSYNLSNTSNQKLGFTTNQIQFGVHFEIKSKKVNQEAITKPIATKDTPNNSNQKVEVEISIVDKTKGETIDVKNADSNKGNVGFVVSDKRNASQPESNDKVNIVNSSDKSSNGDQTPPTKIEAKPISENSSDKSAFNFSAKGLGILQVDEELINKTMQYLLENPTKNLVLIGYSSSDGSNKENNVLSLKRAYVAKEYFILKGVSENRIITIGRGATNPKYLNTTLEGRLKNKRVEIEFK
jgi:outer membrane protein OmpA-like peptidoglycan-associated protein